MKENKTLMQYFEWYLRPENKLWNKAIANAQYLSAIGITDVWFPPAYKGAGGKYDVGYSAYDLYDLGEFNQKGSIETKYGTKDEYINAIKHRLNELNKTFARSIPVLPDLVTFYDVKNAFKGLSSLPIGINKNDLSISTVDYKKNIVNIITSKDIDDSIQFANNIIEEIKLIKNIKIQFFNGEDNVDEFKNKYDEFIKLLQDSKNEVVCVIVNIDKFFNLLKNGKDEFNEIVKNSEKNKNCCFIIVESAVRLKNHQFDTWYKNYISGDTGIWVGNGIDSQYVITAELNRKETISNCGNSFGYAIKQGKLTLVKLIGIKAKEV